MTPAAQRQDPLPPPPTAVRAWPRALKSLHWLSALALLLAAAAILLRMQVDARAARQWLLEVHRHFGLLVLALFCLRVLLRMGLRKRVPAAAGTWPLRAAAALTHLALYALMLALPLLGWTLSDATAHPVHLFGATLPALVAPDPDLADTLHAWHLQAAWLLLGLVLLHIAAALWHHLAKRDDVLWRMLPQRRPR